MNGLVHSIISSEDYVIKIMFVEFSIGLYLLRHVYTARSCVRPYINTDNEGSVI